MTERFGPVPVTALFEYKTVDALARYLTALPTPAPVEVPAPAPAVVAARPAPAASAPAVPQGPTAPSEPAGFAIVGMSGRYPMARDLHTYWENLRAGRDCVGEIPLDRPGWRQYAELARERYGEEYPRWGGFLDDVDAFDPLFFGISPLEARFLDPQERLFIQTAWECVEDAGHTPATITATPAGDGRARVGVFAGVTYNNYQMYAASQLERGQWLPVNSQTFSVANRVSYLLNLGGPSLTVDTACSSSLYAVHLACEAIRRGECEAAIAGGVNLSLHPSKYVTLAEANFTSRDGRCRSFGEGGDGYVPAEAVGAVLIKSLARALADGDHVYAVIRGSAVNHDGRTFGYSVPNPVAQAELVRAALDNAGVEPGTVGYVEAHGTGTSLGDPIEVRGLAEAFGERPPGVGPCALGSVKSGIGHAEAAAGIAQLHKVALQLAHRTLVPSLTHSAGLNPHIDFDRAGFQVQRELAPWPTPPGGAPRRAGISSFGAGGVNVHLVLEEAPPRTAPVSTAGSGPAQPAVLVLSARTEPALREYAAALAAHLCTLGDGADLTTIAWTLQAGRQPMAHRLALVATDPVTAADRLHRYATGGTGHGLCIGVVATGTAAVGTTAAGTSVGAGDALAGTGEPVELIGADSWERIARDWVAGRVQSWRALYPDGQPPTRVSLPTYPFVRERYWIVDPFAEPPVDQATGTLTPSRGGDAPTPTATGTPPTSTTDTPSPTATVSVRPGDEIVASAGGGSASVTAVPESGGIRAELAGAAPSERFALLAAYLRRKVAALLELPADTPLDLRSGFFELGMDSVLATRLGTRLERDLDVEVYANLVFDHPNVAELSAHLLTLLPEQKAPEPTVDDGLTRVTFTARWEPADPPAGNPAPADAGPLLVFDTDDAVHRILTAERAPGSVPPVLVLPGDRYARLGSAAFQLRPDEPDDHATLLADLGAAPSRILYLWPRTDADGPDRALATGLHPAFHLTRALLTARPASPVTLLYLHRFGADGPDPVHEAFAGFGRSVLHENPRLFLRTVGVQEPDGGPGARRAYLVDVCRAELPVDSYEDLEIRYRWGRRWTRRLRELDPAGGPSGPDPLAGDGACLITGGAGGLGLIFARHLARRGPARLVLTGRTAPQDTHRAALAELSALGAEAIYLPADVTDRDSVARVVAEARERFDRISGVIHSAGMLRDGMLVSRTLAQAEQVIAPKLRGALHLDAAIGDDDLDYFVLFSSLAAVGGNAGQTDYAFANRFLAAFAAQREERRAVGERHGLTRALVWPFWREGGMRVDAETEELVLRKLGIGQLDTGVGLATFDTALATAEPEAGVVQADPIRLQRLLPILPPVADPPSAAEQALRELLAELDG
ncbi:type I polyketide synthase [Micromonospora sp. ATCC 39149]|uniref:type I polyketide synthase n=1 Tax=Micromonospora sp. (strain ATCC 39149 / NRRL 15099 / SCC 1413) TaxID=219305 RepID=UPI0002F70E61|nr:SDR family NAD(P)-dependent oxidoreductase [Micromonospora sp. ATCC 39149]